MRRHHRSEFAGLALAWAWAMTLGCGSDSDPSASPATTAGTSGTVAEMGVGGGAATPMGQVGAGGTMNAGLDGASIGGAPSNTGGAASTGAGSGGGPSEVGMGGGPGASPFPSDVTRPKIMIIGDSITAGPGCYKQYLLAELNADGYSNFDFVGEYADDCGGGVRHSARSCTTALDFTQPTFTLRADCGGGTFPGLSQLMTTHQPDLLMIQLGVNDVWNGLGPDAVLANYATLVQQARAQNPDVVVAVAQIHQIRPTPDGDAVFMRAEQLITAVPAWAVSQSQSQSPIFVADLWTNSDASADETLDGVHPNDAGARRMGLNWSAALENILTPD
jgi:hypothetical protein